MGTFAILEVQSHTESYGGSLISGVLPLPFLWGLWWAPGGPAGSWFDCGAGHFVGSSPLWRTPQIPRVARDWTGPLRADRDLPALGVRGSLGVGRACRCSCLPAALPRRGASRRWRRWCSRWAWGRGGRPPRRRAAVGRAGRRWVSGGLVSRHACRSGAALGSRAAIPPRSAGLAWALISKSRPPTWGQNGFVCY